MASVRCRSCSAALSAAGAAARWSLPTPQTSPTTTPGDGERVTGASGRRYALATGLCAACAAILGLEEDATGLSAFSGHDPSSESKFKSADVYAKTSADSKLSEEKSSEGNLSAGNSSSAASVSVLGGGVSELRREVKRLREVQNTLLARCATLARSNASGSNTGNSGGATRSNSGSGLRVDDDKLKRKGRAKRTAVKSGEEAADGGGSGGGSGTAGTSGGVGGGGVGEGEKQECVIRFEEGAMGVVLQRTGESAQRVGWTAVVSELVADPSGNESQAQRYNAVMRKRGGVLLQPGMVLTAIGGESTQGHDFDFLQRQLVHAGRPLQLTFRDVAAQMFDRQLAQVRQQLASVQMKADTERTALKTELVKSQKQVTSVAKKLRRVAKKCMAQSEQLKAEAAKTKELERKLLDAEAMVDAGHSEEFRQVRAASEHIPPWLQQDLRSKTMESIGHTEEVEKMLADQEEKVKAMEKELDAVKVSRDDAEQRLADVMRFVSSRVTGEPEDGTVPEELSPDGDAIDIRLLIQRYYTEKHRRSMIEDQMDASRKRQASLEATVKQLREKLDYSNAQQKRLSVQPGSLVPYQEAPASVEAGDDSDASAKSSSVDSDSDSDDSDRDGNSNAKPRDPSASRASVVVRSAGSVVSGVAGGVKNVASGMKDGVTNVASGITGGVVESVGRASGVAVSAVKLVTQQQDSGTEEDSNADDDEEDGAGGGGVGKGGKGGDGSQSVLPESARRIAQAVLLEGTAGRPVLKGTLFKRSKKLPTGRFCGWQKRFVSVGGGMLGYFASEGDMHPKGEIDLHELEEVTSRNGKIGGKPFTFDITTGGKLICFSCQTAREQAAWTLTLQAVVQMCKASPTGGAPAAVPAASKAKAMPAFPQSPDDIPTSSDSDSDL